MTLKELLELIQKKAADIDFGVNLEEAFGEVINAAVEKVTAKNQELLGKLKAAQEKAKDLPEDFSVERWEQLQQVEKDFEASGKKVDEQVASVKEQMTTAHSAEMKKLGDENKRLSSALESQLIDNTLTQSILAANGNAPLLLPHIKTQIRMVQDDNGNFSTVVVDPNGNERFSLKQAGEKMTIDELVGEFKVNDTFKSAFRPDNSGGGAGGSGGKGGVANPWMKGTKEFSLTEQARIANSDPAMAKQLQTEAQEAAAAQQ